MNYEDTLQFLYKQLPMYQRVGAKAFKKNLDNTIRLCEFLDNPQDKIQCIHVAGTNGKGSVCHILSAIAQTSGLKTGLYTSPHLLDYRERIRVNNQYIPKTYVQAFINKVKDLIVEIKPSFFELTVALAFDYFHYQQVDVAIIETGLGGRLDSTNVIQAPLFSIITNIGLEHTQILGETLDKIAFEKAGIIKNNRPCIIGVTQKETAPVFEKKTKEKNSKLFFADQEYKSKSISKGPNRTILLDNNKSELLFQTDLQGLFQIENIQTSKVALDVWKKLDDRIEDKHFISALKNVQRISGLQGRFQKVNTNPITIVDCAHNPAGIQGLLNNIQATNNNSLKIIFGCVEDKDLDQILNLLPKRASYHICCPNVPRGMHEEICKKKFLNKGFTNVESYSKVSLAVDKVVNGALKSDSILIFGSVFVASEAIEYFNKINKV